MTIVRLFKNYKPFAFFTALAVLLFVIALAFFIPVLINFFQTGTVEKIPTVIVCGITALAAIISLFSGLVLNTIKQKNRQDFEQELHNASNWYKILK